MSIGNSLGNLSQEMLAEVMLVGRLGVQRHLRQLSRPSPRPNRPGDIYIYIYISLYIYICYLYI